jgi:hypothetical protein
MPIQLTRHYSSNAHLKGGDECIDWAVDDDVMLAQNWDMEGHFERLTLRTALQILCVGYSLKYKNWKSSTKYVNFRHSNVIILTPTK